MDGDRLGPDEIRQAMRGWSAEVRRLGAAARRRVLAIEPSLAETIAFNSLCYYKAGVPYGVIGGNVCCIAAKGDELRLGFLHGAFLSDPAGLFEGTAKAKRELPIRSEAELERPEVEALIRAAAAHDPTTTAEG